MFNVVIDTNVFVAAGFNSRSNAAAILQQVRNGSLRMIWHPQTRDETEFIINKIPPLSWSAIQDLFRLEDCFTGELDEENQWHIPDPEDRKFTALSKATGAILITLDKGVLITRESTDLFIMTPKEFMNHEITSEYEC